MRKIVATLTLLACLPSLYAQSDSIDLGEVKMFEDMIENNMRREKFYAPRPLQLATAAMSIDKQCSAPDCSELVVRAFLKAWNWDLRETLSLYLPDRYPELVPDFNENKVKVSELMLFFDEYFDMTQLYNMHKDEFHPGNIVVLDFGNEDLHIGICTADGKLVHNRHCKKHIDLKTMQDKVIRNYTFEPESIRETIEWAKKQRDSILNKE